MALPKNHRRLKAMKRRNLGISLLGTCGTLLLLAFACKEQSFELKLSPQQWAADLDYLQKTVSEKHANAFNYITENEFLQKVEQTKKRITEVTQIEAMLEIEKLAAAIGDGHTWATKRFDADPYLLTPLYFRWFEDGIRVVGIEAAHQQFLGWHLQMVNDQPIERVLAAVQAYIPQNENRYYRQYWETYWLRNADALFCEKICPNNREISYTFCKEGSTCQTLTLSSKKEPEATAKLNYAYQPVPFFMTNPDQQIWFRAINEQVFYIKVNQYPNEAESLSIGTAIYNTLKNKSFQKIVFDFRINGGGNKDRVEAIVNAIYPEHTQAKYYAIVGDHSFSAALANAIFLQQKCGALILGEPPTNRPNFYAENFYTSLPNSKIRLSIATKYYKFQDDDAPELQLDQFIPRSFEAYQMGKDPTLRWVLEH